MHSRRPSTATPHSRLFEEAADALSSLGLFELCGRELVAFAGVYDGDRIADVCCGTGSSALFAASVVGSNGRVVGLDGAEAMVALARARATAQGAAHARFICADASEMDQLGDDFDVVLCGFALFFLPDMLAQTKALLGLLRKGGRLAISTWASGAFEPLRSRWSDFVQQRYGVSLHTPPWEPIGTAEQLEALLRRSDAASVKTRRIRDSLYIREPARLWQIILGTGMRAPLLQRDDAEIAAAREAFLRTIEGPMRLDVTRLYAIATSLSSSMRPASDIPQPSAYSLKAQPLAV